MRPTLRVVVDTNVWMYAVGRPHTLQPEARQFFADAVSRTAPTLCTSAEVLQELLHAYLPVARTETLDAALQLVKATEARCWPIEPEDVWHARDLVPRHPTLGARDLLHLACCRRRGVHKIRTFDQRLAAAFAASGDRH